MFLYSNQYCYYLRFDNVEKTKAKDTCCVMAVKSIKYDLDMCQVVAIAKLKIGLGHIPGHGGGSETAKYDLNTCQVKATG